MSTARLLKALAAMPAAHAKAIVAAVCDRRQLDLESDGHRPPLQAAAAFERDMQPICNAVVAALQASDIDALRGLRAMLPHLLEEINASPALADALAHQMGSALLKGLNAAPEEAL